MDTTELQLQIKERFRLLVLANKGPTACEKLLSFPQSHISEAMSKHRLDRMPRADHIAFLEAACGQLIVTGYLADIQGYDLELRENSAQIGLFAHFARIVREMSDVQVRMAESMADGSLSEAERTGILNECQEAINALQSLMAELRNKGLKAVK